MDYTKEGLLSSANTISTETQVAANTAPRVGGLFKAIIEYFCDLIGTNVSTEASQRSTADTTLQNNINTEITTRTSEIARLEARIASLESSVSTLNQTVTSVSNSYNSILSAISMKAEYVDLYENWSNGSTTSQAGNIKETILLPTSPFIFVCKNTPSDFAVYSPTSTEVSSMPQGNVYYIFENKGESLFGEYIAYQLSYIPNGSAMDSQLTKVAVWSNDNVPDCVLRVSGKQWATAISGNINDINSTIKAGTLNYKMNQLLTTMQNKVVDFS